MFRYAVLWVLAVCVVSFKRTQEQEGLTAVLSPKRDFISSQSVITNFKDIPTAGFCFMMCRNDNSCLSFFFHPEEQFCQLHSVVFQQDSFWLTRNGTEYYHVIFPNTCGSLDYVYHPPTSTCYRIYCDIQLLQPDALLFCQQDGGNLISLQTFDKFWHIRDAVMTFPQFHEVTSLVIIGAIKNGTSWSWIDGEPLPFNSSIWSPGRPFEDKDQRTFGGFRENFDFYIIDGIEKRKSYCICERTPITF